MPNERTSLLERAPMGPSTMRDAWKYLQGLFSSDLAHAISCATLTLLSFSLKFIALFCPSGRQPIVIYILGEICNEQVPKRWSEIAFSFHAAVSQAFNAVVRDPEQSDKAKDNALDANRKATSILDTLEAVIKLLGHFIFTTMGFSKAGWPCLLAMGATGAIIALIFGIQYFSFYKDAVTEATERRRAKERKSGEEVLVLYMISERSLQDSDSRRRSSVLIVLCLLTLVATPPPESHIFMFVIPSILNTDEKLGKMWKYQADAKNAWSLLNAYYPRQALQQEVTHNLASHPRWVSRLLENWRTISDKIYGVAGLLAQTERYWREGSKYKVEVTSRWTIPDEAP